MMKTIKSQQGVILIEALIGILVFALGILAMVGLQALSISNTTQSRNRAEASYFANQIIGRMWVADKTQLATYANYGGAASNCDNPAGAASANANVANWLKAVRGLDGSGNPIAGKGLPSTTDDRAQISVAGSVVTVRVCWRNPQETNWHVYVVTANINNAI